MTDHRPDRTEDEPPPADNRLAGIKPMPHDPEERQSRQDRGYDNSPFDLAFPWPKWAKRLLTKRGA